MLKRLILAISDKIDEKYSVPNEIPSCNASERHPNSYHEPIGYSFITDMYINRCKL